MAREASGHENERPARWHWITILLLLLVVTGLWGWQQRALNRQTRQHTEALERLREELVTGADARAGALAERGAESLFRAFAAGVQPAVLAGRDEALMQSKNALLLLPDVTFVHVLALDGRVLVSSDDKYSTTGEADEQAAWALQADRLARRDGTVAGVVELAGPLGAAADPNAVLWMGVNRDRMLRETAAE